MFAIENAKLSSKGQMVIPDSFPSLEDRLRKAQVSLEVVRKIGISLPADIENGPARRKALAGKHA